MIPQPQSKTRTVSIWTYLLALTVMLSISIIGCGGGGGGDGSTGGGGGGGGGTTYSGLTDPAVITEDNAKEITAGAMDSGSSANGFTGIASLSGSDQPPQDSSKPFLTDLSKAIKEAVQQVNFEPTPDTNARTASESDTMSGDCGGTASYSIQVNEQTGAFSGSMSFAGFCEDGMTISGSTTFSGVVNTSSEELSSFTFTFTNVTGTSGSESYTMNGQIEYSQSGSTIYVTMDMAIKDNNKADYVCKVENYQVAMTDRYGSSDLDVSGRFYEPEHGYVDLDTTTVLVMDDGDEYPKSGVITLTGDLGIAGGATKARLTALSNTQCQVEADTNGDGTYDYDSGPVLWSDLENEAL